MSSTRAEKMRALREERWASGLCPGCGAEPARRGEWGPNCRAKRRAAVERHRSASRAG